MAGPTEHAATAELLERLEVVQDQPSSKVTDLDVKGKIKKRPVVIFGMKTLLFNKYIYT